MTQELPPWPEEPPRHGNVVLRQFGDDDVSLALAMGEDPYIPLIGTLPAHPTLAEAREWVQRQRRRYDEGTGLSFAVADTQTDEAVGTIGLWLRSLAEGRATVGYSVSPERRGQGVAGNALAAVTEFAWTIPQLHRIELYIEPWNEGSIGVARVCGYVREGLLRSHQEIGGSRKDMLLYAKIRG